MKPSIYIVLFLFGISTAYAQADRGEIESGEFVIKKNLEITLPQYDRYFEKVPPLPVEDNKNKVYYQVPDFDISAPPLTPKLRVLKLKSNKIDEAYRNYVRAGFGNYVTPYLEGFISNKDQEKVALDVYFGHLSSRNGSVDKEFSGDSHTNLNGHAKIFGRKIATTVGVGYVRDAYHYYGYESKEFIPDEDSIKQVYQTFNADLAFESLDLKDDIQYSFDIGYHHKQNSNDVSEGIFDVEGDMHYALNDEFDAHLNAQAIVTSYKSISTLNRNIFKIKPVITIKKDDLLLNIGLNMAVQNDTSSTLSNALIYPVVTGEYNLWDQFLIYGGISGDLEQNTWQSLTELNPYSAPVIQVENTSKPLEISIGVKGNFINEVGYDLGMSYAAYKNMVYFVNNPLIPQYFMAVYDDGTSGLFRFRVGLDYAKRDVAGVNLKMVVNKYNPKNIAEPFHRPAFETNINAWYNLYDKIRISTDWFYLSGLKGLETDGSTVVDLDNVFDINLSIDYAFSEKYSAFINVNNLLGKNYEQYYRYPVRGLQIMLGVSASF